MKFNTAKSACRDANHAKAFRGDVACRNRGSHDDVHACRARKRHAGRARQRAADAAICLAAAAGAHRRRRDRQAREPHAHRGLQGAGRPRLFRPVETRTAARERDRHGNARQPRPVAGLRRCTSRRGRDHRGAARQLDREERSDAGARRRADRAWPRLRRGEGAGGPDRAGARPGICSVVPPRFRRRGRDLRPRAVHRGR